MNIIKAYNENCIDSNNLKKMASKPMGIIVHSTGFNNPYTAYHVEKSKNLKRFPHAFIGYDEMKKISVVEIIPQNICCRNVGIGMYGSLDYAPAYLQIEICEDSKENKNYYNAVFEEAIEYCAHICNVYNLSVQEIVSHKEAYEAGYGSNYKDPEYWMKIYGETMSNFREKVAKLLNVSKTDAIHLSETKKIIPGWVKLQNEKLFDTERRFSDGGC